MSFNTDEIIQSYFENHSLVQHQINSFNVLVDDIIPNIFSQYFPITLDYKSDVIKKIILKIVKINNQMPHLTENNGCSVATISQYQLIR